MCYSAIVRQDLSTLERNYKAIVDRDQVEDYRRVAAADPKRFPPLEDRIYPGHYAPVIFLQGGQRIVELMRYGAYPPPSVTDPRKYTAFNARRDNLGSPFWSEAFRRHHGFAVLGGFYEWVAVKDVVAAGIVTMEQVRREFDRLAAERRAKIETEGKRYKPTPTERQDPRFRKIVVEFQPRDKQDLLVPVIFSEKVLDDGRLDRGFAVVTDDPPPEISEAGHDRCPVVLDEKALGEWLRPEDRTPAQLEAILTHQRRVTFTHALPEAA